MADIGFVRRSLLGIPDATTRQVLISVFEHLMGNLTYGAVDPANQKATNFRLYFQTSTTAAVSNAEFSIAHAMDSAPHLAIPVLDLSQPGAKIVPIEVVRAADSKRLFLRSTSTGANVSFLVE